MVIYIKNKVKENLRESNHIWPDAYRISYSEWYDVSKVIARVKSSHYDPIAIQILRTVGIRRFRTNELIEDSFYSKHVNSVEIDY